MAVIKNGILGAARNKVGNVVAASWKGINYVRAYAIPANPNSADQQTQRAWFKKHATMAIAGLSGVIQEYWDGQVPSMSGYNRYMQINVRKPKSTELKDTVRTMGKLEPVSSPNAIVAGNPGDITVTWNPTCLGNGLGTDLISVEVYDEANAVSILADKQATRADGTYTINVGEDRTATGLVVFIWPSKPGMVANSVGCVSRVLGNP